MEPRAVDLASLSAARTIARLELDSPIDVLSHVAGIMQLRPNRRVAVDAFAFMAVDPSIEAATGQFFGEGRPIDSSLESDDASKARRSWELAAGFMGFDSWPHAGAVV